MLTPSLFQYLLSILLVHLLLIWILINIWLLPIKTLLLHLLLGLLLPISSIIVILTQSILLLLLLLGRLAYIYLLFTYNLFKMYPSLIKMYKVKWTIYFRIKKFIADFIIISSGHFLYL